MAKVNKSIKQPCQVDQWRCPICNRDARPGSLVVDEWLCGVKERLIAMGKGEDTKSIVVGRDGEWRVKVEKNAESGRKKGMEDGNGGGDDSDSGSDGDGDGMRASMRTKSKSAGVAATGTGSRQQSRQREREEITIIDLSD